MPVGRSFPLVAGRPLIKLQPLLQLRPDGLDPVFPISQRVPDVLVDYLTLLRY